MREHGSNKCVPRDKDKQKVKAKFMIYLNLTLKNAF